MSCGGWKAWRMMIGGIASFLYVHKKNTKKTQKKT